MRLTDQQREALEAVCNTFIPSIIKEEDPTGYWKRKATDLPIIDHMIEIISKVTAEEQKAFIDLLDLMNSYKLGLTWLGPLKKVTALTDQQRESMLRSWASSTLPVLRGGYNSLKKLIGFCYFGILNGNDTNPNWKTMGYPGPLKAKPSEIFKTKGLKIETVTKDKIFSCDVVVIGSGAGGGVVAAELAKKGMDVIILEKGAYITEKEMNANESDMMIKGYDRSGAFSSVDGSVAILAGSCVGGGTTVNWSASFRTPDYILEEWAKEHDNPQFLDPGYEKCFEFIEKRANINTELNQHNNQNQYLFDGAKKLGYHAGLIPRNVAHPNPGLDKERYWKSQGYGGMGDSFGNKQGTMKTFLQDALDNGARLFANTQADQITHSKGKVKGVVAVHKDQNGHKTNITFSCKKVVVSAGALHSPAILLRSGLKHPQIGKNLYLHPVNAVSAVYDHPMESWNGPMMSAVSDEFIRLDGNFGYKIETPPLHSGFSAYSMTWESGLQFKEDMLNTRNTGVFITLTRDKYGGTVSLNKEKRPIANYKLHKYDRKHLVHGIQESAKIHHASGAQKIQLLHNNYHTWKVGEDFDMFIKKIGKISWAPNRFIMYSAHQMGTCRMGGRDKDHPIKPNGESREIENLYVADASVFPRCSGVNPMLSIQALAYYISQQIT